MGAFIDKTGKIYGSLTVLYRANNRNGRVFWHCKCVCGKECDIRGDKLTDNYVDDKGNPSCGCLRIKHMRNAVIKVKPGDKYGRLTVLEETDKRSKNGSIYWKCQCDCGNITEVASEALNKTNGGTQSCGCLQKEKARQILNSLTAEKRMKPNTYEKGFFIKQVEIREKTNNGKNESWALAICPFCQTEKWIPCHYIRSGDVKSCGCLGRSAGETKIKQILDKAGFSYITEKTFEDCLSKKKNLLRYDFFVNNKFLIEFDGEQHTNNNNSWWSEEMVEHDLIKNNYAKEKGIPLIRIPYTAYDTLVLQDLVPETSKYLI